MAAGTVDPEVHRKAVAMYETLEQLIPDGEDRVEISLSELARESIVFGDTPQEREVKQVWAYLRRLECVDNAKPRFKMALGHPEDELEEEVEEELDTADASFAPEVEEVEVVVEEEADDDIIAEEPAEEEAPAPVTDHEEPAAQDTPEVNLSVDPDSLVAQATAFSNGLESSLDDLGKLRDNIETLVQELTTSQRQHNALVDALYDMRDQLADTGLGEFVDQVLGDELWHYEDA